MQKQIDFTTRAQITFKNVALFAEPIKELYYGIKTNTIPWHICAGWMVGSSLVLMFGIDQLLISHSRFSGLYPYYPIAYKIYAFSMTTAAFWLWAWSQVKLKKDKLAVLTNAFKNGGLQSKIGRVPNLISDFAIDPMTRKMRLTNAGFPVSSFQDQSKFIESELGIFIDDIKENRERRAVDVIYSHYPMATEVIYTPESARRPYEFLVGQTRAHSITSSLRETPHLLVAGQTGGGKSTFLRQLIIHIACKHEHCKFLLIDLKGGLEFSLFEGRKRFIVVPHVLAAVAELEKINTMLEERMAFLKANKCKDIDGYFAKKDKPAKAISLDRQIVVVDEAAEMFLAGHHAKAKEIQAARGILSRIARQGRAVGVHIVVATQRPDSRSLDPQVKANLTGVICFQMMNDASSIAVLGNGRATDLPKIPGRAIWKNGIEMIEVQTPFLSVEEAEALLVKSGDVPSETADALANETASDPVVTAKSKEDYRKPQE
jgi:S-DNA-T family DNA segregation ATPase FtsK/SpoIIIE